LAQGAPVFYDNWVARDINGTALENAPFEQVFHHAESNHRFQRHLPIQGTSSGPSSGHWHPFRICCFYGGFLPCPSLIRL
jgi:hypothetical protein